jgi:hypothetical protein
VSGYGLDDRAGDRGLIPAFTHFLMTFCFTKNNRNLDWTWYFTHKFISLCRVWLREGSIPGRRKRIFPLASVSRPALGPTHPRIQCVRGGPFAGGKARLGRYGDHSPHLVPRSWMSRSYYVLSALRLYNVLLDCFNSSGNSKQQTPQYNLILTNRSKRQQRRSVCSQNHR